MVKHYVNLENARRVALTDLSERGIEENCEESAGAGCLS